MDSKPINRSSSPTHLPREQNRNATQTTATTRDSRSVDASPAGATNYVSRSGIDSASAPPPSYSEYMASASNQDIDLPTYEESLSSGSSSRIRTFNNGLFVRKCDVCSKLPGNRQKAKGVCTHIYTSAMQEKGKPGLKALNRYNNMFFNINDINVPIHKVPEKYYDKVYKQIDNLFSDRPSQDGLVVIHPSLNYHMDSCAVGISNSNWFLPMDSSKLPPGYL